MSSKYFYVQQLKALHTRYGITKGAITLLKALDQYHMGSMDAAELGRMVRLSSGTRKALTDTITKCATAMEKKPEEVKDCVALIKNCTEILGIADVPPPIESLSFMKFPQEIRQIIYKHYLRGSVTPKSVLVPRHKKGSCFCPKSESAAFFLQNNSTFLSLARTSKTVKEEFLSYFYSQQTIHFVCVCEMQLYLNSNLVLKQMLQSVQVHWRGQDANKAFKTLADCPNLEHLTVVISKSTTMYLTERQEMMNRYFGSQTRPPRLSDANGIDELLELRGLQSVKVAHISSKAGCPRTHEDKAHLHALLASKALLPRQE